MKKNYPFIIILVVNAILLNGCNNEYNCPGYPHDLIPWFPYTEGDWIYYTDLQDTIEFQVVELYKEMNPPNKENHLDCITKASAKTNRFVINSDTCLKISVQTHCLPEGGHFHQYKLYLHSYKSTNVDEYYSESLLVFNDELCQTEYYEDSIYINGFIYYDVLVGLPMQDGDYTDFVVSKSKGLVMFRDTYSGNEWYLVNE